jgi:hypothetical protein
MNRMQMVETTGDNIKPQTIARVTGVLFLITFIPAIPARVLYEPVRNDPRYILGAGADTRVFLGAFFEMILVIAIIGTAVVLFPILKRQNEVVALGYVAARVFESAVIVVGILSLLSVVTLRQDLAGSAGADAASLTAGKSLVAIYDWTFLLGPGLMPGVNGVLLGYLMYRSGLVPRGLAMLGLIGGPVLFASATATLFGVYEQVSVWGGIATALIFVWEMGLAIYLIVKGFKPSPIISDMDATVRVPESPSAVREGSS